MLSDFSMRILDQFPHAEKKTTMEPPTQEEMNKIGQLLQINLVEPVMAERSYAMFKGRNIPPQILNYYKLNDVNKFTYSRPFHKGKKNKENEFATLWVKRTEIETRESFPGILRWSPMVEPAVTYELTPLENGIEGMEKANESLSQLLQEYNGVSNPKFQTLSMKLNGIIGKDIYFA